jgi:hypothetical protein
MERRRVFEVDLARIEGDGDFSCPRCENSISPDDESEQSYSLLEPKVNRHGLTKLIIRCNNCASRIHLTGFPFLEELAAKAEEELESEKPETPMQFSRLRLPLRLNLGRLP